MLYFLILYSLSSTPMVVPKFCLFIVIYDMCAVYMYRGYGDTERPLHKKDYQLHILTQDIAELIPALGYKSCVLVAHDWGGMLAW